MVGVYLDRFVTPRILLIGGCLFSMAAAVSAASLESAKEWLIKGEYERCLKASRQALSEQGRYSEEWGILLGRALLRLGRYQEAEEAALEGVRHRPGSLRLRWLAFRAGRRNGSPQKAKSHLKQIYYSYRQRAWAYQDSPDLVAFGRALLELGVDPKIVLEQILEKAHEKDQKYRGTYLAAGRLALEKHDYKLAAEWYQKGLKHFPKDPDLLWGVARAYKPSDRAKMMSSLKAALKVNPSHAPSYLLMADHLIDSESYDAALEKVKQALKTNPDHPKAWAYRAVMAHLKSKPAKEARFREKALAFWETNPEVDYLIGFKLSQKYRFREGAEYQRLALEKDPDYLPAKIQLAQDLLRLGKEDQGWALAKEVREADQYNVRAYNLLTLKDKLESFTTLTNRHFVLRMEPKEAALYGDRALELLGKARDRLAEKYGVDLKERTVVEIFPEQKDFGVRTFGMPDNPGYLGVCFGDVITMNSPASQTANPRNWEAVLWHEFCHVITLNRTRNKMPRWLSEGISVFEEKQADSTWGQSMTPQYRRMILNGELTPIQDLSAAFLAPKSGRHLQFAYYEASLVVEFLVREFGLKTLKDVLTELGEGREVYAALADHTVPLKPLEERFESYAKEKARELGSGFNWKKPGGAILDGSDPAWEALSPNNYWVLRRKAERLIGEEKWKRAKKPLKRLIEGFSEGSQPLAAVYRRLARVHRELGESEAEYQVLKKLAACDSEAIEAYRRLMKLASERGDWEVVAQTAGRYLAVSPLRSLPFRYQAEAQEALGHPRQAMGAYRKRLKLSPTDPAAIHFRLARLMQQTDTPGVKRQVLKTLEHAPRFRKAHAMLLDQVSGSNQTEAVKEDGRLKQSPQE